MSPTAVEVIPAGGPEPAASDVLYRDGLKVKPKVEMPTASDVGMPSFDDPYKARAYMKERLALAFHIFAKHGFDDGVAGHITLRVSRLDEALIYMIPL